MNKQVKFVSLAEFKALSDGPGGWEGYLSRFGELDDGGDIVPAGAYADTIEQFLTRGFNTESHDWAFSKMIGFPLSATEDGVGLYIKSQFHSTPDAQLVRTKAQERLDAGKGVYMSIGYEPSVQPIIIYPKDYQAEIPRYCSPDQVEANLQKAARFSKVRVLPKVELYEGAIVTTPMLRSAAVTSVKAHPQASSAHPTLNVKGMFEDELAERTNSLWSLFDVLCTVVWRIQQADEMAEQIGAQYDLAGALNEALAEFSARVVASVLEDDTEEDTGVDDGDEIGEGMNDGMGGMGYSGRSRRSMKRSLVDGLPFGSGLAAVVDAAKQVTERAEKRHAMRAKEGRTFSAANVAELDDLRSQLADLTDRLAKLLDQAASKPKEDAGKDAEKSAALTAEINKLLINFQKTEAKLNGVQI